jgi:glycerol uptake facilitator-like aquaporin
LAVVSILNDYKDSGVSPLFAISISQPLLLVFCILAFGNTSGGHISPMITFALWISNLETFPRLIMYSIFQLVGFVLGSYCTLLALDL